MYLDELPAAGMMTAIRMPDSTSEPVSSSLESAMHAEIQSKLPQIHQLCREHSVKRLELFGSAAADDFDPARSDVDFLVEFLPVQRRGFDDVYFKLYHALAQLMERPVDLVEYGAIRNPYFLKSVDDTKVGLYAAA
jgi:predicted nucleotidyltransferase